MSQVPYRLRYMAQDTMGFLPQLLLQPLGCGKSLKLFFLQFLFIFQMIKLLSVEKGKRKDTVNLNFVCGGRVLAYLGRAYEVEKSLNVLLR